MNGSTSRTDQGKSYPHAHLRFTGILRYALIARLTLSDTGTPTVCRYSLRRSRSSLSIQTAPFSRFLVSNTSGSLA